MVQTIINLDSEEDKFLNIFKAKRGIRNKNDAIKVILNEYSQSLKKEENDYFFLKVKEAIVEYEKSPKKNKLTKEEFLEELETW